VFVRADFAVTLRRAEERDREFGGGERVRRDRERYIPGQQMYLTLFRPQRWASVIVDNNDPTNPRIQATGVE
jgi:hypothetical protein